MGITQYLKDTFYYCESSPSGLRWTNDRLFGFDKKCVNAFAGDVVGSLNNQGYYMVWCNILKRSIACHRIVYCICNDIQLDKLSQIDHIDGNRTNNLVSNLREVSAKGNARNQKLREDNNSGVQGVTFNTNKTTGYTSAVAFWVDQEGNRKQKYFSVHKYGLMESFKLAVLARKAEISKMVNISEGYSLRHGNKIKGENYV